MAFESLTEKFKRIIKGIRGQAHLTEANMDEMLKEVRIALLEADVNFKVVKAFIENIKTKAIGEEVYTKLNPSQMVVKIVHDELVELLGSGDSELKLEHKPAIIMMVGLQGTGKTTTAGKLAYLLKNKFNKKVLMAAGDIYRPGAIDQLEQLGKKIEIPVFSLGNSVNPVEIAKQAKQKAIEEHFDVLLIDTAGRLQIDEPLMKELNDISDAVSPDEILLLVDAMSGQDAINVANAFHSALEITGIVMSKLDGDARGGSALSIKHLTGIPIKFAGVGEKVTDLDVFHPDRMADRILGMGDIVTLAEKVKDEINEKEAKNNSKKDKDKSKKEGKKSKSKDKNKSQPKNNSKSQPKLKKSKLKNNPFKDIYEKMSKDEVNSNMILKVQNIALDLEMFENAYLAPVVHKQIVAALKMNFSTRLFSESTLDIISSGESIAKVDKKFQDALLKLQIDFLRCDCAERPFCDCLQRGVSYYILAQRLRGKDPIDISKNLLKEYQIQAYPGDIFSWLDTYVRSLDAIKRVAKAFGKKEIVKASNELIKMIEKG